MRQMKIADSFAGRIIRFRDGDTCNVEMSIGWDVIICRGFRFVGLESWEPEGATRERAHEAARVLTELYGQRQCSIMPATRGLDLYGRLRGHIIIDGADLGQTIVHLGLAWHLPAHKREAAIVL